MAAQLTRTGTPFTETFRGADLYPGPHRDVVPDLIVESDPRMRVLAEARQDLTIPYPNGSPDNALDGIFVAAGPQIRATRERGRASVVDVTPTVLNVMGLAAYEDMDGHSLAQFLNGVGEPVVIPEQEGNTFAVPEDASISERGEEEQLELEERLRSLGYAN